jgi:hypothetical protein
LYHKENNVITKKPAKRRNVVIDKNNNKQTVIVKDVIKESVDNKECVDKYCKVCKKHFINNDPNIHCCSPEHQNYFEKEQKRIIEKVNLNYVPCKDAGCDVKNCCEKHDKMIAYAIRYNLDINVIVGTTTIQTKKYDKLYETYKKYSKGL